MEQNKNSIALPLSKSDIEKGRKRRWIPAATVVKKLKEIRYNPSSWKAGGAGGQDQYAGMPPFLRIIDEIIKDLEDAAE